MKKFKQYILENKKDFSFMNGKPFVATKSGDIIEQLHGNLSLVKNNRIFKTIKSKIDNVEQGHDSIGLALWLSNKKDLDLYSLEHSKEYLDSLKDEYNDSFGWDTDEQFKDYLTRGYYQPNKLSLYCTKEDLERKKSGFRNLFDNFISLKNFSKDPGQIVIEFIDIDNGKTGKITLKDFEFSKNDTDIMPIGEDDPTGHKTMMRRAYAKFGIVENYIQQHYSVKNLKDMVDATPEFMDEHDMEWAEFLVTVYRNKLLTHLLDKFNNDPIIKNEKLRILDNERKGFTSDNDDRALDDEMELDSSLRNAVISKLLSMIDNIEIVKEIFDHEAGIEGLLKTYNRRKRTLPLDIQEKVYNFYPKLAKLLYNPDPELKKRHSHIDMADKFGVFNDEDE